MRQHGGIGVSKHHRLVRHVQRGQVGPDPKVRRGFHLVRTIGLGKECELKRPVVVPPVCERQQWRLPFEVGNHDLDRLAADRRIVVGQVQVQTHRVVPRHGDGIRAGPLVNQVGGIGGMTRIRLEGQCRESSQTRLLQSGRCLKINPTGMLGISCT